ncbi:imidazoleglycerol-phosphate dehydratase HisB [soil metagenome]
MIRLSRQTRETSVNMGIEIDLDTAAPASDRADLIRTTDPFLDHMLLTLARYSGLRIEVDAAGDLRHHLIEDVAITLGQGLRRVIPPTCARYGAAIVPMDEALVQAALDAGGRFFYRGPLPSALYDHFLRSFAEHAGLTLHLRVMRGRDRHHIVEAAIKAVGLALRDALRPGAAVFSTKGAVDVKFEEGG